MLIVAGVISIALFTPTVVVALKEAYTTRRTAPVDTKERSLWDFLSEFKF